MAAPRVYQPPDALLEKEQRQQRQRQRQRSEQPAAVPAAAKPEKTRIFAELYFEVDGAGDYGILAALWERFGGGWVVDPGSPGEAVLVEVRVGREAFQVSRPEPQL